MISALSGRLRNGLVLTFGLTVILAGVWAMPASSAGAAAACRQVAFSVQIPSQHTLRGTVCGPVGNRQPRAVLMLVHGSTYDRSYWDFPVRPSRYSALRLLAARGYLTVGIDRLGSGESDRPPSEQVTADAGASALHQVVTRLRNDPEMRTRSGKVFAVGHSSGSTLAIRMAAKHGGVDGLVVTGFLHTPGSGSELFLPMLHPAAEDPRFAGDASIPAGYVTTQPGVRILWYYGWNAEEQVLAEDERTKDAMPGIDSGGFVDEVVGLNGGPFSRQLKMPVLAVIGDRDLSNCTPPSCPEARAEAGFYPASPDFRIVVRPRVAHDLNLHADARKTTDLIRRWADQHST